MIENLELRIKEPSLLNWNNKKTVILLFIIALLLLASNLYLEKITPKLNYNAEKSLPGIKINNIFLSSLKEFSIDNILIKIIKSPDRKNDSLKYCYSVTIPFDLPIPVILQELNKNFSRKSISIFANELSPNYFTSITILSEGQAKLYAELTVNKNLSRKEGEVGFIITGFENLNIEEQDNLLYYPDTLTFLLIPSLKSKDVLTNIINNRKDYLAVLNDDISDINFKLKNNYSKDRLRISIHTIITTFVTNNFLFVDNTSSLYNSQNYQFIKSEFSKKKCRIIPLQKMKTLNGKNDEEVINNFKLLSGTINANNNLLLVTTVKNFYLLKDELKRLKKRGVSFISGVRLLNANI
jgi:hypothetical protein